MLNDVVGMIKAYSTIRATYSGHEKPWCRWRAPDVGLPNGGKTSYEQDFGNINITKHTVSLNYMLLMAINATQYHFMGLLPTSSILSHFNSY